MLAVLLAFLLLIQAPGSISVDCDHGYVTVLYGKALQDSAMKKGRRGGFMMQAYAAGDGNALFSASGTVYISSDNSDVRYGDGISVHGSFSGPVFSAYSITLHQSPEIQSLRNRAVDLIRTRLRASGEAGELGMRLLLGYGERGVFSLSEDAAEAGLMHVLALSGMHLSILSSMISFSLFFLPLPFRMRFISIFLVLFSFLSLSLRNLHRPPHRGSHPNHMVSEGNRKVKGPGGRNRTGNRGGGHHGDRPRINNDVRKV